MIAEKLNHGAGLFSVALVVVRREINRYRTPRR